MSQFFAQFPNWCSSLGDTFTCKLKTVVRTTVLFYFFVRGCKWHMQGGLNACLGVPHVKTTHQSGNRKLWSSCQCQPNEHRGALRCTCRIGCLWCHMTGLNIAVWVTVNQRKGGMKQELLNFHALVTQGLVRTTWHLREIPHGFLKLFKWLKSSSIFFFFVV